MSVSCQRGCPYPGLREEPPNVSFSSKVGISTTLISQVCGEDQVQKCVRKHCVQGNAKLWGNLMLPAAAASRHIPGVSSLSCDREGRLVMCLGEFFSFFFFFFAFGFGFFKMGFPYVALSILELAL